MLAGNLQGKGAGLPVGRVQQERGMPKRIIGNLFRIIVCGTVCAEGNNPTGQSGGNLIQIFDGTVDDKAAVRGKQPGKFPEGMGGYLPNP